MKKIIVICSLLILAGCSTKENIEMLPLSSVYDKNEETTTFT